MLCDVMHKMTHKLDKCIIMYELKKMVRHKNWTPSLHLAFNSAAGSGGEITKSEGIQGKV